MFLKKYNHTASTIARIQESFNNLYGSPCCEPIIFDCKLNKIINLSIKDIESKFKNGWYHKKSLRLYTWDNELKLIDDERTLPLKELIKKYKILVLLLDEWHWIDHDEAGGECTPYFIISKFGKYKYNRRNKELPYPFNNLFRKH